MPGRPTTSTTVPDPDLMPPPQTYTLERYLDAKQSIDARALNRGVEERFFAELTHLGGTKDAVVRVLDVGAGLAPTAYRVVRAIEESSTTHLRYDLLDRSQALLEQARASLANWLKERSYRVEWDGEHLTGTRNSLTVGFRFHAQALAEYLTTSLPASFNAVIAQSFLDLTDTARVLKEFKEGLRTGALLYFPLHLDGETRFLPTQSKQLSDRVLRLYHESMKRDTDFGTSDGADTGKTLLRCIPAIGELLEVGSSDWFVLANDDGEYPQDEAYFLYHILHFVENELQADDRITPEALSDWLSQCRRHVEDGTLIYQAHQIDVLGRIC